MSNCAGKAIRRKYASQHDPLAANSFWPGPFAIAPKV
jgi:hypothetical protein